MATPSHLCTICEGQLFGADSDGTGDEEQLLSCGHTFHATCLTALEEAQGQPTCPTCDDERGTTEKELFGSDAESVAAKANVVETVPDESEVEELVPDEAEVAESVPTAEATPGRKLLHMMSMNSSEKMKVKANAQGDGVVDAAEPTAAAQPATKKKRKAKANVQGDGAADAAEPKAAAETPKKKRKVKDNVQSDDVDAAEPKAAAETPNVQGDGGSKKAVPKGKAKGKAKGKGGKAKAKAKAAKVKPEATEVPVKQPVAPMEENPLALSLFSKNFMAENDEVYCNACATWQPKTKARCVNKGDALFKCSKCQYTDLQLMRKFGTASFISQFTADDRNEFYKACLDANPDLVAEKATAKFTKYRKVSEYFENGGKFLPLSVWGTKGYDVDLIRENSGPEDTQFQPQCGLCYRVRIKSSGIRGEQGNETTHDAMLATRKRSVAEKPALALPAPSGSKSDSSSSTSSSSSSTSDKKKKKKKKSKKAAKKAAKKAKRKHADEKAQKRASDARKKAAEQQKKDDGKKADLAESIKCKADAMVSVLAASLDNPYAVQAPDSVVQPVRKERIRLENVSKQCALVLKDTMCDLPVEGPKD